MPDSHIEQWEVYKVRKKSVDSGCYLQRVTQRVKSWRHLNGLFCASDKKLSLKRIHTAFSLPDQFAPRSKSASRTLSNSLPGPFAPWPTLAHSLPDHFAPWNFGSRNFPSVDPEHYYAICDLQPLDGSAAAACRTYPTGFQQQRKFQGAKVSKKISFPGAKGPGHFAPESESSRERNGQRAKGPGSEFASFLLADSLLGANWPGSEKARYRWRGTYNTQAVIISAHGIARGIIFYRCGLFLSSFVRHLISDWSHWTDLNQTQTHIHLWLLFENLWSELLQAFNPPPHGLRGKIAFLGPTLNFDWMTVDISLQQNMISTIGNFSIYRDSPACPKIWWNKQLRTVGEFLPTAYNLALGDTACDCQPYRMDVI